MIAKNLSDSKMTEKTIPTVVNIASNELKPRTYIIIVSTEFLDLKSGFCSAWYLGRPYRCRGAYW